MATKNATLALTPYPTLRRSEMAGSSAPAPKRPVTTSRSGKKLTEEVRAKVTALTKNVDEAITALDDGDLDLSDFAEDEE